MPKLVIPAFILICCKCLLAAPAEKPTSFCYGTIGPGIKARLRLRNGDGTRPLRVALRVQTVAGIALGSAVTTQLKTGEEYEATFGPADTLQQIWALLTVQESSSKGAISMHSDGVLQGSMTTEKEEGSTMKTRTSTLTPILVQDPGDRPRGVEPNRSVLQLGAFFTGDFAFVGNPREHSLEVTFCGVKTRRCWQGKLAPRAAISVSLAELKTALGITSLDEYVACRFGSATAFCNMRNAGADSAITFGEVR